MLSFLLKNSFLKYLLIGRDCMLHEKLKLLPTKPGCYLMKDEEGIIIYVGKAKNLKRRVNSYFQKIHTGKTKALVDHIVDFDYIITNSEVESLILEIHLIKKYSPKYNILLKDDKTYPYIVLTNEKYPSLKIVRSKNRKKEKDKLFGPFPNVVSARKTVEILNRIYPLKKCNHLKKDVCLYYHIGECLGFCKYDVAEEKINEIKKEIGQILNGDYKLITKKLEEEMMRASEALEYEKALELKRMIDDIKVTLNKQIIVSNIKYNFDVFGFYEKDHFLAIEVLFIRDGVISGKYHQIFEDFIDVSDVYLRFIIDFYEKYPLPKEIIVCDLIDPAVLKDYFAIPVSIPKKGDVKKILDMAHLNAEISSREKVELIKKNDALRRYAQDQLKEILHLKKLERIELFDNSHLFGTYYVGGMVVFDDFLPNRKEYRKYKISLDVKDDLSAMKEVIYRRYFRILKDDLTRPDLIIVDGGELQVEASKEILDSLHMDIKVIGLKKDDHHRTHAIIDDTLDTIVLPKDSHLFLYLTKMQDEVHRYAISYHRDIKSRGSMESILEQVDGIGPKRRNELLKHFGSIRNIQDASMEEITKIIPRDLAITLKEFLDQEGWNKS